MTKFVLLYFASAARYTKKDSDEFEAPLPLSKLFGLLERTYPGITSQVLESSAVTINQVYVDVPEPDTEGGGVVINPTDEVAIIPPVSSG
ncbi:MAG: hypothetical protein M1825_004057 [Sarcosagium campestre]|nr:MAG: hypothetical protein M1825_004057 [Sarcosagium campestre]